MYVVVEKLLSKAPRPADPGQTLAKLNGQIRAVAEELAQARAGVAKCTAAIEALGAGAESEQELRGQLAGLHERRALGETVKDEEFTALHSKLSAATALNARTASEVEGWRRARNKHTIRAADAEERLSELRAERKTALVDVLTHRLDEAFAKAQAAFDALAQGPMAQLMAVADAVALVAKEQDIEVSEIVSTAIDPIGENVVRLSGWPLTPERSVSFEDRDLGEIVKARTAGIAADIREAIGK